MTTVLFAERFKAAREKSGLTLKELKDRIGVSVSALSHYANGANLPPLDVAAKLANELSVSLDWLCGINKDDQTSSITDCADVAITIEHIRDLFSNARIFVEELEDGSPEHGMFWSSHMIKLVVESEALWHYFKQIDAANEYSKSLPKEARSGFEPYKITMHDSLLAHLRTVHGKSTGLKIYDFPVEVDELPF